MAPSPARGVSRRDFVRSAVAIGGTAALAACLERETPDLPRGPDDLGSLPDRQHAWNAGLQRDDHGNHVSPRHHLLVLLDHGDGIPTAADREQVEAAFRSLERASPRASEGLLWTVGYSPAYFERFDEALHESVDLPEPEALAPFEDPAFDTPDAVVHLASNYGSVVVGAEEALRGEVAEFNGVGMDASLQGVLERVDRRSGFVGDGLPADNQSAGGIPDGEPVAEDAPLYMGFKSGFERSQATEDAVTIDDGPFTDGTTQHVSKIHLNLEQWYEQDDRFHREATMFCPFHAENGLVEGAGDNLGTDTGITENECPAHAERDARQKGVVGHSQKSARARDGDGNPLILRRDFDSADDERAQLHFVALQETVSDFVTTREAMNGTDLTAGAVGQRTNNGILQYMRVVRRGNYLVPPRRHRALPTPRPG
jgi:hypothetical protein